VAPPAERGKLRVPQETKEKIRPIRETGPGVFFPARGAAGGVFPAFSPLKMREKHVLYARGTKIHSGGLRIFKERDAPTRSRFAERQGTI